MNEKKKMDLPLSSECSHILSRPVMIIDKSSDRGYLI